MIGGPAYGGLVIRQQQRADDDIITWPDGAVLKKAGHWHLPWEKALFHGAILLKPPDTAERHARQQLSQLIRVGGKLAVLGVEDGLRAMGWWHVARPGTWDPPKGSAGTEPEGAGLTYAKALCGRFIVTNGYAADWRPPAGTLCPACAEQL